MEASSRAVDKYCHRWFYVLSATRYYAGAARTLFFQEDDILSITTLKTDEDGDGTFENTLTENTDFFLYPLNGFPKFRIEINPDGNYGGFGAGIKRGIEIVGLFGYGDGKSATPYADIDPKLYTPVNATETELEFVGATLEVGWTIILDSEQMYVTAGPSENIYTVKRAVNGTTGASHAAGVEAYVYDYPDEVREAVIMLTARLWKRRVSAYARVIATPELGQIEVYRGMDDDVKMLLQQYIKPRWF
jgi:hypothetical protein